MLVSNAGAIVGKDAETCCKAALPPQPAVPWTPEPPLPPPPPVTAKRESESWYAMGIFVICAFVAIIFGFIVLALFCQAVADYRARKIQV